MTQDHGIWALRSKMAGPMKPLEERTLSAGETKKESMTCAEHGRYAINWYGVPASHHPNSMLRS